MCGIAGIVCAQADRRPDSSVLSRMLARLRHRGPDDEGAIVRGSAALGMRRLKIIDLETGRQPMTGEDEQTWVVFNGEIYNYRELTQQLRGAGHVFRTRSDTEVIVHGYEDRGIDVLRTLEGMFGLAIWDERARTLVLARDRVGIKPLYYAVLPDQLVFASEIKALLEHPGIDRALDIPSLSRYLAYEYIPAPHAIVRSIRKLPAGHWLAYTDGRVKVEPYWNLDFSRVEALDERHAVQRLRDTLDAAVRRHLISDVPLGVFLSGGVDSSTVAAFAAPHVSGRLQTFSIGFTDASFDESVYARRVAQAIGSEHHEDIVAPSAVLDLVERLPDLTDEPLGDASILPTHLLSRFARRSVTVALSGDGGDELFAGYPTYQAHRVARLYQRVPHGIRERIIRPLVHRLPVSHDYLSLDFRLKRFVDAMVADDVERHARWMGAFTPTEQRELFTADTLTRIDTAPWDSVKDIAVQVATADPLNRLLYLDFKGYLGEGVLTKVDRASMACSLEVRVPILDREVVELAATLPPSLKLHGLTTKYLLKRAMRDRLPADILKRRKQGFAVPLSRWFRRELAPLLADTFASATLRRQGLFRPDCVERLLDEHQRGVRDHRKKLYTLLVFQLWAARYRAV